MLTPRQLRRNALLHLMDGVFFMTATAVFSGQIVVPSLTLELTPSRFLLGLRTTILWACLVLPQLWYVRHVEGLPYKRPTVLLWAAVQRIGRITFLIWISVFWGNHLLTLVMFYTCFGVCAFGGGMVSAVWSDWFAKTTDEKSWNWIMSLRPAIPAIFIVLASPLIKRIMDPETCPTPLNYQILLGTAVVLWLLSYGCAALVHEEHEIEPSTGKRSTWRLYMKRMAWTTFRRPDFRLYMLTRILSQIPLMMLFIFLMAHADDLGVTPAHKGSFTAYHFGFLAFGAIVGGRLSAKFGPTVTCRIYPLLTAAACFMACFWCSADAMVWVFAVWGVAAGMCAAASPPILLRYAGPYRRPIYAAVSITILGLTGAIAPPIIGTMLDWNWITSNTMFCVMGTAAACSWLLFVFGVPRWPMAEEDAINSKPMSPRPE